MFLIEATLNFIEFYVNAFEKWLQGVFVKVFLLFVYFWFDIIDCLTLLQAEVILKGMASGFKVGI